MRQYHWNHCPAPTRAQVETLMSGCWRIFGEDVTGIYLHGSLAMGCFQPDISDLDLLLVVERALYPSDVRLLSQLLLETSNQPHPIEITVLDAAQLQTWQYPTPYAFHYSEAHREAITAQLGDTIEEAIEDVSSVSSIEEAPLPLKEALTDFDLAAHFVITRERGVTLYGKPARDVLPVVPTDDYIDSILDDFDSASANITQQPVYGVLNLCRVYWFLAKGAICSKDEAGEWALSYLPEDHRDVVMRALRQYREGKLNASAFDAAQLRSFAAHVETQVRELLA